MVKKQNDLVAAPRSGEASYFSGRDRLFEITESVLRNRSYYQRLVACRSCAFLSQRPGLGK